MKIVDNEGAQVEFAPQSDAGAMRPIKLKVGDMLADIVTGIKRSGAILSPDQHELYEALKSAWIARLRQSFALPTGVQTQHVCKQCTPSQAGVQ